MWWKQNATQRTENVSERHEPSGCSDDVALLYLLTYTMEQSPSWEANWFYSWSRNSPRFRETEISLTYSQGPTTCYYPNQIHPVTTTHLHFLKIHLNIILPSTSWSPQWPHSLRFPHQNLVQTSPFLHTCHMTRPSHDSRFYHPHSTGLGVQVRIMLYFPLLLPCPS